jgi:hypothetical protein
MGKLATEFVDAADRSHHDRDDLMAVARDIVAKTDTRIAAEIAWAVLSVVAQSQARQPPHAHA